MTSVTDTEILRSKEAMEVIEAEKDPVTRALLNNANFWLFKRYFEESVRPASDYDHKYFIELLRDIFREHDVLRRILAGEQVGKFYPDEHDHAPHDLRVHLIGSDPCELVLRGRLDVVTAPILQTAFYDSCRSRTCSRLVFNCTELDVVNPWVVAIVYGFAEEARECGAAVEFKGLDTSWTRYMDEAVHGIDLDHRRGSHSFIQALLRRFAELAHPRSDKTRK